MKLLFAETFHLTVLTSKPCEVFVPSATSGSSFVCLVWESCTAGWVVIFFFKGTKSFFLCVFGFFPLKISKGLLSPAGTKSVRKAVEQFLKLSVHNSCFVIESFKIVS